MFLIDRAEVQESLGLVLQALAAHSRQTITPLRLIGIGQALMQLGMDQLPPEARTEVEAAYARHITRVVARHAHQHRGAPERTDEVIVA